MATTLKRQGIGAWLALFAMLMIFVGPLISQSMPMDHPMPMGVGMGHEGMSHENMDHGDMAHAGCSDAQRSVVHAGMPGWAARKAIAWPATCSGRSAVIAACCSTARRSPKTPAWRCSPFPFATAPAVAFPERGVRRLAGVSGARTRAPPFLIA